MRTRGSSSEKTVKDIRRATRKQYSAEEKIRIVLDGLRGEETIAELCRQEGIAQSLYYSWSKEFLEAGKKRLAGVGEGIVCNVRMADAVGLDSSLPYEPRRMLSAETIATGIIPSKNNNTMIGKN